MNGSQASGNTYVVRLRGLPWNTSQNEIQNFLQGCQIRQTQFSQDDQSRGTRECFVVLETKEDLESAKTFNQKSLGSRYIEVIESNADELSQIKKSPSTTESQNNIENWREPVVRLRGLPYNSSKDDVTRFFDGLEIAQNGVHISSSKPAGEAFVAFVNMDNAMRALEFNRKNIGHRYSKSQPWQKDSPSFSSSYIEVFKSTYAEARASIMNDTQSAARQRSGPGSNQNYGSQRQGNYSGSGGHDHYNNTNQYNGPQSNNYNSFSGHGNNYSMSGGGVKRPMSISFTMKIRGVPFEAGEKEVFEFFNPIVPIRLEQENTPRGKPPIWYAEFGSREEATEALTYHKKYMGTRYIELLPMYDDGNRSKTVRN